MILFISLLSANFRTVGSLEYGILKNDGSVRLDDSKVYGPGIYGVGPGSNFLTFPSKQQTIMFVDATANATQTFPTGTAYIENQVSARSKDGLVINMNIVVNYVLGLSTGSADLAKELINIYNAFKDGYKRPATFIAESAILEIMSGYNAKEVWSKRLEIKTNIGNLITTNFKLIFLKFKGVEIMNMDLPAKFAEEV